MVEHENSDAVTLWESVNPPINWHEQLARRCSHAALLNIRLPCSLGQCELDTLLFAAPSLRSLVLTSYRDDSHSYVLIDDILKLCPNLVHITLEAMVIRPMVATLTTLISAQLSGKMPHLREISLANCTEVPGLICTDTEDSDIDSSDESYHFKDSLSWESRSIECTMQTMLKWAARVVAAKHPGAVPPPIALTALNLQGWEDVDDAGVRALCKHLPALTHLSLDGAYLSSAAFDDIGAVLGARLKSLRVLFCDCVESVAGLRPCTVKSEGGRRRRRRRGVLIIHIIILLNPRA